MIFNFKKLIIIFSLIIVFSPCTVFSNDDQESLEPVISSTGSSLKNAFGPGSNVEGIANESGYKIETKEETTIINEALSAIINTVLSVLGLIFVILTIFAGFKWMTASGNQENVNKAKTSLRQNIIGLAIVVTSWGIWNLVLRVINQF